MTWLFAIGAKLKGWMVGAAVVAVALGIAAARIFAAGKREAEAAVTRKTLKNVEKAHAAEREVEDAARRGEPPPERLRKFYID